MTVPAVVSCRGMGGPGADTEGLGRQLRGYGAGLTAYYAALMRHRPGVFPELLRLLPAAAGYMLGAKVTGAAAAQDFPPEFKRQQRRGMLSGPALYVKSVRRQARAAASEVR